MSSVEQKPASEVLPTCRVTFHSAFELEDCIMQQSKVIVKTLQSMGRWPKFHEVYIHDVYGLYLNIHRTSTSKEARKPRRKLILSSWWCDFEHNRYTGGGQKTYIQSILPFLQY